VQVNATLASPLADVQAVGDDARRFESLYRTHYAAIHAYARRRLVERADDVAAETFLVAWRRLDDVPGDPLPWLYGVARRVISDLRRGARRQAALVERVAAVAPADLATPQLADRELASALAALSERDRELLLLVYWEDLEPSRAARALGCSRAAAATRLWRARRRLQANLERSRGEEE
jgi:RNA polymerase sigma-70 factor, ECF subfamily